MVNARKEALDEAATRELLGRVRSVLRGQGKSLRRFDTHKDDMDEIVAACLGRSGTLKAPSIRVGRTLLVGFHEEAYREVLG